MKKILFCLLSLTFVVPAVALDRKEEISKRQNKCRKFFELAKQLTGKEKEITEETLNEGLKRCRKGAEGDESQFEEELKFDLLCLLEKFNEFGFDTKEIKKSFPEFETNTKEK